MLKRTSFFAVVSLCALTYCSDVMVGVDQSFLIDKFDLPTSTNPIIIDVDESGLCPQIELDSNDTENYQVRISPGVPLAAQTTFSYDVTEYHQDGNVQIIHGENATGSNFDLSYDPDTGIYTIKVDYNCINASDTEDCTTTMYSCSGPLIE